MEKRRPEPPGERAALHRLVFAVTCRAVDRSFPECLRESTRLLGEHYGAAVARLYLGRDPGAAATYDPEARLARLRDAERHAYARREAALVETVRRGGRPARAPGGEADVFGRLGAAAGYGLPLPSPEGTLGVLVLYTGGPRRFGPADLDALAAVANVLRGLARDGPGGPVWVATVRPGEARRRRYHRVRRRLEELLEELRRLTAARTALLVDRRAAFVARRGARLPGETEEADVLLAGGYAAARRAVRLLGLPWEGLLVHEGTRESLYVQETPGGALLALRCTHARTPDLLADWLARSARRLEETLAALTEEERP